MIRIMELRVFYLFVGLAVDLFVHGAPNLGRAQDVGAIGQDLFRPGACRADLGVKKFLSNDICGVTCAFDVDCDAPQKCCPNSCGGTICSFPFVEDPCAIVACTGQGEICRVNENGIGVCECNDKCPEVYQPVCANSGKMFDNRCKMDYRACKREKIFTEVSCLGSTEATPVTRMEDSTPSTHDQNGKVTDEEEIGLVSDEITMTTEEVTTSTVPTTEAFVEPLEVHTDEPVEPILGLQMTVPEFQVVEVTEGEDTRLYCDAISPLQAPIYIWLYHRDMEPRVISPGHQKDGVSVTEDGHFLTVTDVNQSITGIYTCMVKTNSAFQSARYDLKLKVATVTATYDVQTTTATTTRAFPNSPSKKLPEKPHVKPEEKAETNSAICSLPVDEGNCLRRDNFPKWYYDLATQQCRQFTYSGCGGNDNRFNSYSECLSACPVLPTDPCQHPIYTGPCRAHIVRWGYDEVSRECEQFVYGGCGKNGNNFERREACSSTCIDTAEKREECECVDPPFIDSICSSHFVLTGYVRQKMISPGFGALLSVEAEAIIISGNLTTFDVPYLSGPLVVIRDVAQDACQCHDARADGKLYLIMGYINEDGYAIVDDTSYVKVASQKRLLKLTTHQERSAGRC